MTPFDGHRTHRRVDFREADTQVIGGQRQAIEARCVVTDQGRVTSGANAGDDRGDGVIDSFGRLPRLIEQVDEAGLVVVCRGGKSYHVVLSPDSVAWLRWKIGRSRVTRNGVRDVGKPTRCFVRVAVVALKYQPAPK